MEDTIFALASARGRAGVSVIRLSGSQAFEAAEDLIGPFDPAKGRSLRLIRHPESGEIIDEALILFFDVGKSFTGEKTVEFQIHGSVSVTDDLLEVLGCLPGLRLAEPGEFTRKAMENGRLDLVQVEGLADLIDAETSAQRRQALGNMRGVFSTRVDRWRQELVGISALIEVMIDFADEELPDDLDAQIATRLAPLVRDMEAALSGAGAAERIRSGFEVAIIGAPNAGKSTLLNRLAGRKAAITSDIAGTTRDIVELRMDVGGLPVTFLDTAGLRDSADQIEKQGIELAIERAVAADLRIFLLQEPDQDLPVDAQPEDLLLRAKQDEAGEFSGISGRTGQGVDAMLGHVSQVLGKRAQNASGVMRLRQKLALTAALEGLAAVSRHLHDEDTTLDLIAEDMRYAVSRLDSLVGRVDVEHILDEIFSRFCLGK